MAMRKIKDIFIDGPVSPERIAKSIAAHASKTDIGAHSIFLGQVRADTINGQVVEAIEYSSFREMALEKMHLIREGVFARYPLSCMHVYHSLGRVEAGQICLFVFTSSSHRQAATEACREIVEQIKAGLPVWGKECYAGGGHHWKENKGYGEHNA